ncbi:zinc finger protein 653-like isoform X1 [Acipenser oxyrinchus oxyrinchus]|uniref:Zinc finger protein 653-like isoform X1 n=1 Tax=Acipenser oxyrinchus oxyrinchus TaxID=40147 RepID=A0AAD8CLH1_ACIOX|nr:zinc finger protein 653-like isoform X1 [Acipenser oxyrinchus oxyrinchus]
MAENSAVKEEATCSVEVTLDRDSVRPVYDYLNRPRGRPRLPDWARNPRRLKGRKKYDARRVYLGETHRLWCRLRRRTPYWSDGEFAQYLLKLEGRYGEAYREKYGKQLIWEIYTGKPQAGEQCDVNCLHSLVSWYEEHRLTCPHEPQLRSLEPGLGFSTSALWQCQGGHGFHQHLSSPDREASDSENESRSDPEETTKDVLIQGSATENQQHQCQSDAVSYNPALLAQSDSCTQETDAKRPACESLGLIEAESSDCNSDSITTIEIQDPTPLRPKRHGQGLYIESDGTIKTFRCPYEGCSQVYVTVKSYRNHVNIVHKKGRTEVCSHPGCGKKFYLLNHLQRHMVTHSEARDFTCALCAKSFKRKNHLEVHQRTHTGETPLQCQYCGFQCRQRASLNWHMKKKHTPAAVQYDYTCELCGKGFEKVESVKFHKLKSHPERTEREGRGDTHSPPDS